MLRLRLRAWLGWGCAPDDLRVQSAQLFRAALVGFVGYGLLVPLLSLIVGMFYEPFGAFAHNLLATRSGLFYGGLLLALALYLLIPATTRRRLASRGEGQPPAPPPVSATNFYRADQTSLHVLGYRRKPRSGITCR
jgi:hypothetical protein